MTTLLVRSVLQDVDRVMAGATYKAWALTHRTDAGKIKLERAGQRRPLSNDPWARTFIEAIRVGIEREQNPLPPKPPEPTPTPPAYKKVAPKTVNPEGASDQRFCMDAPGVVKRADGFYTDESGAVYAKDGDGLEESSVRNKDVIPGLVGAKSMDGRSACQCPTVGDPTKNTGSWKV